MDTTTTIDQPIPVRKSSRTCFGIEWYATEAEAETRAAQIRERGDRYNGGYYDGMPCGRDTSLDIIVNGKTVYAVTVA